MAICWERLSCQLFTVLILNAVLVVLVPFDVWGGMWNSIVSAPDHYIFVYFSHSTQAQGRLLKSGPAMGRRKRFPSAEGTRLGEHQRGVSPSRKGGSGDLARENFRFRKAVDAFYCILSAISVYKFSQFCRSVGRNINDNCYV